MSIHIILAASFIVTITLSIQVLRKTRSTSLLAWHILFFTIVNEPASYFIDFLNRNSPSLDQFFFAYDPIIVKRIQLSLILVNSTSILFLFLLYKKYKNSDIEDKLYFSSEVPVFFYISLPLIFIGFISYLSTPMAQTILNSSVDILGEYDAYYAVRYQASSAGMSLLQHYMHYVILITLLPLMTLYCLQRSIIEQSKKWAIWWLIFVIIWLIIAILLFAKFNMISLVATNMIVAYITLQSKLKNKIRYKIWAGLSILFFLFFVNLIYQVLGASENFSTSILLLFERFVAIPINTTWNHFVVFPDLHPHTYYSSSRTLNLFLGFGLVGHQELLPYQIVAYILTGIVFNMNTGFLGSSWAEMGYVGVLQAAVIIWGIFFLWDSYLIRRQNVIAMPALIGLFLGKIWNINNNDLIFMLIPGGLLFAPVLYILLFKTKSKKIATIDASVSLETTKIRQVTSNGLITIT